MFGDYISPTTAPIIPLGGVASGQVASGQIGTFALSSGAVTAIQMASGRVISGAIGSGSVGGGIGTRSIASGTLGPFDFASGSVLSGAVASGQITKNHTASGLLQNTIQIIFTAVASGERGDLIVPDNCRLNYVNMFSDVSGGSCFAGIWKDTVANYPPTSGDTIAPSGVPLISGAIFKSYSGTAALSGWVTAFNKGDVLKFVTHSGLTMARVTVALQVGIGD